MKYQLGDLVLVKHIPIINRFRFRWYSPFPCALLRLYPHLINTYGVVTKFEKHGQIFKSGSTEKDNGYIWYSQTDQKEYYFYEDEVEGEVIK